MVVTLDESSEKHPALFPGSSLARYNSKKQVLSYLKKPVTTLFLSALKIAD